VTLQEPGCGHVEDPVLEDRWILKVGHRVVVGPRWPGIRSHARRRDLSSSVTDAGEREAVLVEDGDLNANGALGGQQRSLGCQPSNQGEGPAGSTARVIEQLPDVAVHEVDDLVVHRFGLLSVTTDRGGPAVLKMIAHELPSHRT